MTNRWRRYRNPPGVYGLGIDRDRHGWAVTIGPWTWTTETP